VDRLSYLGEVLQGLRGHEGVREVAIHPERYGVAESLAELRDPRTDGAPELLRTKYKPGRSLKAYYRVPRRGGPSAGRHLVAAWVPERPVDVLVSPVDPALPQLERLTRMEYLAARVEQLLGRSVRPLDRLELETVRYRPGQRHVLLARFGYDLGPVYLKTDRDDSGARAVAAAGLVAELLARRCPDARAATPIGYLEADAAALWWAVPAPSLARLLCDRPADGSAAVEGVGRAMRAIHDGSVPAGHPAASRFAGHDARAEAATVRRAGAYIGVLLPDVGSVYARVVRQALEQLDELPGEPATLVHGDAKAENLLVDGGHPLLLDFDRSCRADPALDLGKLVADLAWWRRDTAELERVLRAGYGPCDPARWARARWWSVLFRLRIAARRCAVHDADWPDQVRARVAAAEAAGYEAGRR
jgi:aminoglycoside phosphotransferase (APT) family kinase protein